MEKYMDDMELAEVLEKKGHSFWQEGEFNPVLLSETALKEGYQWKDIEGSDAGWYLASDDGESTSSEGSLKRAVLFIEYRSFEELQHLNTQKGVYASYDDFDAADMEDIEDYLNKFSEGASLEMKSEEFHPDEVKMPMDELFLSKIAFLSGCTTVYVNEFGPDLGYASPSKWIIDSCSVNDFAFDVGIIRTETDAGDTYSLPEKELAAFLMLYEKAIEMASRCTIDELLIREATI